MITAKTAMASERSAQAGRSAWFDLPVPDLAEAMSFYEGLFGWTYQQMQDSPLADYVMIDVGGTLIGGLRRVIPVAAGVISPKPLATGHPVLYFTVDDLDASICRAKELGAPLIGAIVDLGNGRGRYQWIQDRAGHVIGLWGNA